MSKSFTVKEVKNYAIFETMKNKEVNAKKMEQCKKDAMEGSGYYLELGEKSKLIANGEEMVIEHGLISFVKNSSFSKINCLDLINEEITPDSPILSKLNLKLCKRKEVVHKYIPNETIKENKEHELIILFIDVSKYSILLTYAPSDDGTPIIRFHITDGNETRKSYINEYKDFLLFITALHQDALNAQESNLDENSLKEYEGSYAYSELATSIYAEIVYIFTETFSSKEELIASIRKIPESLEINLSDERLNRAINTLFKVGHATIEIKDEDYGDERNITDNVAWIELNLSKTEKN